MLPGFRFLFATVVLAVSVLVFGLGAAALLRAAHEEFVSLPSWRLAQQPVLSPQFEMSGPTLAMLRVEALAAKPSADKPRQQAIVRDIPRDTPDSRSIAITPREIPAPQLDATVNDTAIKDAEQASTPANEPSAALNAQASLPESAAPDAAVEQTGTQASPTPDALASDALIKTLASAAAKTPDARFAAATASAPAPSEAKSFEAKSSETTRAATEASETPSTTVVAALERSSEATASATLPNTVVKKATRTNARVVAKRRAAIVRARAAARAKAAEQQRQQQNPFPLFGG